jgi:N-acetyl-anhydromuramyl-L-alanine amidase AmpD
VAFLMDRYDIPAGNVLGHRDCKATLCPGKNFDLSRLRAEAVELVRNSR